MESSENRHRHLSLSLSLLIALFKWFILANCWLLVGAKNGGSVVNSSRGPHARIETQTEVAWDNAVDLSEDFRILWTIINQDIMFEMQVRTLGYVGFGFSVDGRRVGSDIAVGWVDKGQTFFQDRYIRDDGESQPMIDPSQDYSLIFGYENITHTVIRFRRKFDTCDVANDVVISNDTMRVMYLYGDEDPAHGLTTPSTLPNIEEAWQPYRPLILVQARQQMVTNSRNIRTLELRNTNAEMPYGDDTIIWCKVFKINKFLKKRHVIKFEPIYDSSWSIHFLQQITLYECPGVEKSVLENLVRDPGGQCLGVQNMPMGCNSIVSSWNRGSNGFTFPVEAGYPIEANQISLYVMETKYHNLKSSFEQFQFAKIKDNSGLRLYITENLRPHDAGTLSIGIEPNWRHIIPPGQHHVLSEGHCLEGCTAYSFPPQGIHIFAVMMQTHQIARAIKLRQIRNNVELPYIAEDNNVDATYQDFRRLPRIVKSLPGDRLVVQCNYNSSQRKAITLGGDSMKEEVCSVLTLYYPRQRMLTSCHSLPSLPTVLHALGIEELDRDSSPVVISSPHEIAGMTLEDRLLSYDWNEQFEKFQNVTLQGTFKQLCWDAQRKLIPISKTLMGQNINITRPYRQNRRCKPKRPLSQEASVQLEIPVLQDVHTNHIGGEGSVRSSRSSFIETLALSGTESSSQRLATFFRHRHLLTLVLLLKLIS